MDALKKGTAVRHVVPQVTGTIIERRFDAADEMEYLVAITIGGEAHERWFKASEIEPMPAASA